MALALLEAERGLELAIAGEHRQQAEKPSDGACACLVQPARAPLESFETMNIFKESRRSMCTSSKVGVAFERALRARNV